MPFSAGSLRCVIPFAVVVLVPVAARGQGGEIDFNRDVRPILSNNCFQCHGPDEKVRKESSASTPGDALAALNPGKPETSELLRRVTSTDPEEAMPPTKLGKKITPREIEILTKWIKGGANYATHWAYVTPMRPSVPVVQNPKVPIRNPVDAFILARLQKENLSPQSEADKFALIRRVSLDLTGLPPTPEEVDAFIKDSSPQAYEKLVDKLLARPTYGEHWARLWLDLARYADSAGYADDPPRTIWKFRDYVITSLNANKPFDQFTIEQLAGDLLLNPTNDQLVATAFHRNTMTNNEGGTNDEEFRNVAVVDRVNTTFTVWMGTSMACAQCHTHKYDPITQKEFFGLGVLQQHRRRRPHDESPTLPFWTQGELERRPELESLVIDLEHLLNGKKPDEWKAEPRPPRGVEEGTRRRSSPRQAYRS